MACHVETTDEEILATVIRKEEEVEEDMAKVRDEDQGSSTEKVQIVSRKRSILDLDNTKEQQMLSRLRQKKSRFA